MLHKYCPSSLIQGLKHFDESLRQGYVKRGCAREFPNFSCDCQGHIFYAYFHIDIAGSVQVIGVGTSGASSGFAEWVAQW